MIWAGCIGGDEYVSHSLCRFSCGDKKKELLAEIATAEWSGWALPCTLSPCSCRSFSISINGIRPRGWHIPEDLVTHASPCCSCCTGQNQSNHFFDPLFLNASNLVYQSFLLKLLQNYAKWGNCIPTELKIHLLLVRSIFYLSLFQFPLLKGSEQSKD